MAGWRFHINGAQSRLAWFNNQPLSRFLIEQDINKVIIGIVPNHPGAMRSSPSLMRSQTR
jgi:hypothetical protein